MRLAKVDATVHEELAAKYEVALEFSNNVFPANVGLSRSPVTLPSCYSEMGSLLLTLVKDKSKSTLFPLFMLRWSWSRWYRCMDKEEEWPSCCPDWFYRRIGRIHPGSRSLCSCLLWGSKFPRMLTNIRNGRTNNLPRLLLTRRLQLILMGPLSASLQIRMYERYYWDWK